MRVIEVETSSTGSNHPLQHWVAPLITAGRCEENLLGSGEKAENGQTKSGNWRGLKQWNSRRPEESAGRLWKQEWEGKWQQQSEEAIKIAMNKMIILEMEVRNLFGKEDSSF